MVHTIPYGPTLGFSFNLLPPNLYSWSFLIYPVYYARKALKKPIWDRMNRPCILGGTIRNSCLATISTNLSAHWAIRRKVKARMIIARGGLSNHDHTFLAYFFQCVKPIFFALGSPNQTLCLLLTPYIILCSHLVDPLDINFHHTFFYVCPSIICAVWLKSSSKSLEMTPKAAQEVWSWLQIVIFCMASLRK